MAGVIKLTYSDAAELKRHQISVHSNNEEIIDQMIRQRLNNGLTTKQKEAALGKIKAKFQPNIAELDAILERLVSGVGVGMENISNLDTRAASAFGA